MSKTTLKVVWALVGGGFAFGLLPTIRQSEYKGCGPKGSKSHAH